HNGQVGKLWRRHGGRVISGGGKLRRNGRRLSGGERRGAGVHPLRPLNEPPLANEETPLPAVLRPRNQLVPGEAAPGGKVFPYGWFRGPHFEEAAAVQGINVSADEEQKAAAAIEIAAVEARVRRMRMTIDGFHGRPVD